nr:copper amine oxidase N-terminal domain-containing protein [Candidatus Eremiobacteraeota bacterium]
GSLLLAGAAVCAARQAIEISINDRPADVHGLLISQKVLMPMRPLFEALGASIQYDAKLHTVYARSGKHHVRLAIGSHGSRLVHFRTYIPLRYIAESLGATVDYDSSNRSVAIYSSGTTQRREGSSVSHPYPQPGQRLAGRYSIGATMTSPRGMTLKRNTLHMFLDGIDVVNAAEFDGENVLYTPSRELDYGRHDVRLEALDEEGHRFGSEWSWFQGLASPSSSYNVYKVYNDYNGYRGYSGLGFPPYSNGINLGFRFYPSGPVTYFTGDVIQLILVAPPGGSAFIRLCGIPRIYYLNYNWAFNYYAVSVAAPIGFYLPGCAVTAIYNSPSGARKIIPLHSRVNIFTKPRPSIPSQPRRSTGIVPAPPLKHREKPPPTV